MTVLYLRGEKFHINKSASKFRIRKNVDGDLKHVGIFDTEKVAIEHLLSNKSIDIIDDNQDKFENELISLDYPFPVVSASIELYSLYTKSFLLFWTNMLK